MSDTCKGVTVTITPGGAFRDITLDGHSIGAAIPRDGAELTIEGGRPPVVRLALIANEIIVKADGP